MTQDAETTTFLKHWIVDKRLPPFPAFISQSKWFPDEQIFRYRLKDARGSTGEPLLLRVGEHGKVFWVREDGLRNIKEVIEHGQNLGGVVKWAG